jgi:Ion channel
MIPLFLTGTADSSSLLYYVRLIALFRIIRLYNIMTYVDGSELIILASMSAVCIIFGGFAILIFEAGAPDSSIDNLPDALWWSIETITTVAYGEYYCLIVPAEKSNVLSDIVSRLFFLSILITSAMSNRPSTISLYCLGFKSYPW